VEPLDLVHRLEQLHERAFAIHFGKLVAAVEIHDLSQQGHFAHPAVDEAAAFLDDVGDGASALRSAGVGHDAEGALHVAALHDADEFAHPVLLDDVIADRVLGILLLLDIDDGGA